RALRALSDYPSSAGLATPKTSELISCVNAPCACEATGTASNPSVALRDLRATQVLSSTAVEPGPRCPLPILPMALPALPSRRLPLRCLGREEGYWGALARTQRVPSLPIERAGTACLSLSEEPNLSLLPTCPNAPCSARTNALFSTPQFREHQPC